MSCKSSSSPRAILVKMRSMVAGRKTANFRNPASIRRRRLIQSGCRMTSTSRNKWVRYSPSGPNCLKGVLHRSPRKFRAHQASGQPGGSIPSRSRGKVKMCRGLSIAQRQSRTSKQGDLSGQREVAVECLENAHAELLIPQIHRRRSHLISRPPLNGVTPVWLTKRDQWGSASGGQDRRCGRWLSRCDQTCSSGAKRAAMAAICSRTGSTLSITASLASFGASVRGELSNWAAARMNVELYGCWPRHKATASSSLLSSGS